MWEIIFHSVCQFNWIIVLCLGQKKVWLSDQSSLFNTGRPPQYCYCTNNTSFLWAAKTTKTEWRQQHWSEYNWIDTFCQKFNLFDGSQISVQIYRFSDVFINSVYIIKSVISTTRAVGFHMNRPYYTVWAIVCFYKTHLTPRNTIVSLKKKCWLRH